MPMSLRRVPALPALALAGVLALTACGPAASGSAKGSTTTKAASKPAADVLYNKARESALAATSVHLKGDMTSDGEHLLLDIAGTKAGDVTGSVGAGTEGTFELRRVGGTVYLRSTKEYWTKNAGAEAAQMIGDKYFKLPADAAKDMNDLTVTSLLKSMFEDKDMPAFAKLTTKVEAGSVNGQDAWVLSDRVGGDEAKLYISTDDAHHLLRVAMPTGKDKGTMDFTEWDAVKPITEPSASQIAKIPGM
ncbi:hypothetical protein [Oryzihumus leptocrescens]|uniref:Lipoprotein n=1 Tax=Oryzihumus leptocrescens TaxID=297536 RepID=A0A542ZG14_9MICO|nr:hypothetical protein [Oryzihumus leptocrescens]TQL59272.1 hypothetical protein FB474_0623 [Oryzihumus leptocrescens]